MLWLIAASPFIWLIGREIYFKHVPRTGFDRPDAELSTTYVACLSLIVAALVYQPFSLWQFERFLTNKAKILAESPKAKVSCNTLLDTIFDNSDGFAAGHANIQTGEIVMGYSWCKKLRHHLANPHKRSRDALFSVAIFAHESMHVRGERNETVTECQAIQRYYRAGKLLGLPDSIAKSNGLTYFQSMYQERANHQGNGAGYYTNQCAPGKELDEQLADSTWR